VFGFDIVAPAATTAEMVPSERLQVVRLKPGTRPVRVLVVEDHADSRQVLVRLLAEAGFQVQEAADGLQAIAVWEEFVPELIWMDINLPQLDGCEATQAIKKRAGGRTVIVALTASAFDDDRRRIEACGIDGFLIKPYREAEIFETMGRLLGVEYDYREAAVPVTAGGAAEVVRLDALPPPVRQRLYRTVLELNVEGLRELAGEVGECDPRLRRCVRRAIESLDFSELLAAFDAQGGEHGSC
jgi:CheY-like chemotaxis protein